MSVRLSVALAGSLVFVLGPIFFGLDVTAWAQEPAAPDAGAGAGAGVPEATPDQPAPKPKRRRSVPTAESQAIGEFAGAMR